MPRPHQTKSIGVVPSAAHSSLRPPPICGPPATTASSAVYPPPTPSGPSVVPHPPPGSSSVCTPPPTVHSPPPRLPSPAPPAPTRQERREAALLEADQYMHIAGLTRRGVLSPPRIHVPRRAATHTCYCALDCDADDISELSSLSEQEDILLRSQQYVCVRFLSSFFSSSEIIPCSSRTTAWHLRTTEAQRDKEVLEGHERLARKNVETARLPENTRALLSTLRLLRSYPMSLKSSTPTSASRTRPVNLKDERTRFPNLSDG